MFGYYTIQTFELKIGPSPKSQYLALITLYNRCPYIWVLLIQIDHKFSSLMLLDSRHLGSIYSLIWA